MIDEGGVNTRESGPENACEDNQRRMSAYCDAAAFGLFARLQRSHFLSEQSGGTRPIQTSYDRMAQG
jgi:hypothetical protein